MAEPDRLARRTLLTGAAGLAAVGIGGTTLLGCASGGTDPTGGGDPPSGQDPAAAHLPYFGAHQVGITTTSQTSGIAAAYDVRATTREELRTLLSGLTNESARLVTGMAYEDRGPAAAPSQPGTVDNPPPPVDLTVTVALGATFFDDRFGLADQRPRDLTPMPSLPGDRLDPPRTHGDLLLLVGSVDPAVDRFALRQLHRATHGLLRPRWSLDISRTTGRNGLGFRDDTTNPAVDDPATMDRLVWVGADDDEPDWATGGTYAVMRATRLLLEDWDRATLDEQERIIGRRRASGAPLDGHAASDPADFDADPDGNVTPLDAHVRLANPRTAATAGQQILRRGADYSRGFDTDGLLDQGLLFLSFQRSMRDQFLPVQERLAGEPLSRYARAEGGGHWFVAPGVADHDRYLADDLIES